MAKQFIVRLKKGDSIVANSQIITVNGIGDGPILASDFTDGLLTGSVTTTSRSGSFIKVIAAPVVTTYTPVITPTTATVGQSIQVAITGGPPNQTVTFRKKGSVNNMFGSGYVAGTWIPGTVTLNGSGAYTDGSYAFPVDGIATYEFTFPTGATWAIGGLNPKTHTITVSAASALTFTITPNVSAINEGGTIGWTIANNAPFTYGTSGRWVKAYAYGTNINGDDVTEDVGDMDPLSEAILFTASGGVQWPGTFLSMTHITADAVTEGAEVIYGNITTWLNGSAESYVAAGTSTGVTINDTSTTPGALTFTITANVSSVNEGGTIGWTLSNNAPFTLGTSGRWVKAYVYGTNINGDDVTEDVGDIDPLSEAILFTASGENQWIGSSFPAMTVITADAVTEGVETIYANVTTWLNGSAESYVAAGTSTGVTINDTSTTPAPTSLSVNIVSSSVSRQSSITWNTQHSGSGVNGGGSLYYSGGAGGSGPFWLADQSQPANHVYLVDTRIPAGRTAGFEWPSDPDTWRTWYASDGTTAVSNPTQLVTLKAYTFFPTAYDNKNNILTWNGWALSNWGISQSGVFIATDNDTSLGLPNSNQSCRIIGTPYVFLGLHYGLNSVQIAVGTKLGEAGAGTATAISISLYEADGTTLVTTGSNPFHTYIPAPNSAGWNGTAYVNNVCWETTGYDQSTAGTYRSNWVDVGQPNNNNSDGSSIVGQIRIRLGSRAPFVLKIQAGHI